MKTKPLTFRKKLSKPKVDSLKAQIARYSAYEGKAVPISLRTAPWEDKDDREQKTSAGR